VFLDARVIITQELKKHHKKNNKQKRKEKAQ
jgi:hypothetical protein